MPNFGPLNAGMASDPMPPGMASGPPNGPNGPPIGAKGAMGGTPGIGASPGKLGKDEVTIGSIGVIGSIGGAFTSWIWVVAPHPKLSDAFTASTAAKGNSWGPNCTKKSNARSTSGTGIGADNTCAASSVAVSWKSTWRRITWEQAVGMFYFVGILFRRQDAKNTLQLSCYHSLKKIWNCPMEGISHSMTPFMTLLKLPQCDQSDIVRRPSAAAVGSWEGVSTLPAGPTLWDLVVPGMEEWWVAGAARCRCRHENPDILESRIPWGPVTLGFTNVVLNFSCNRIHASAGWSANMFKHCVNDQQLPPLHK